MTTALFAAVPELPKGGGVSANVSIADFAVACEAGEAGGPGAFLDALCAAGVRDDDAEVITTAIASAAVAWPTNAPRMKSRWPCRGSTPRGDGLR